MPITDLDQEQINRIKNIFENFQGLSFQYSPGSEDGQMEWGVFNTEEGTSVIGFANGCCLFESNIGKFNHRRYMFPVDIVGESRILTNLRNMTIEQGRSWSEFKSLNTP